MGWGEIIGLTLLALNLVWTITWSIHMKAQVREAKDDQRITDIKEEVIRLDGVISHLPKSVSSSEDVELVHRRVSELKKIVSELAKEVGEVGKHLASVAATVESINGNLDILNRSEFLQKNGGTDD